MWTENHERMENEAQLSSEQEHCSILVLVSYSIKGGWHPD